jgi:hypothetical protein
MKKFITDAFKIALIITGNKRWSIVIAILYLTVLNMATIYGLLHLLQGLADGITKLLILFSYPYIDISIALMLGFNTWLLTPFDSLYKSKRTRPLVTPLIVYSIVSVLLFIYGYCFDKIGF